MFISVSLIRSLTPHSTSFLPTTLPLPLPLLPLHVGDPQDMGPYPLLLSTCAGMERRAHSDVHAVQGAGMCVCVCLCVCVCVSFHWPFYSNIIHPTTKLTLTLTLTLFPQALAERDTRKTLANARSDELATRGGDLRMLLKVRVCVWSFMDVILCICFSLVSLSLCLSASLSLAHSLTHSLTRSH